MAYDMNAFYKKITSWQPCFVYLERLEVVERPEVGEDCGLLGFRVMKAVKALSSTCG